MVLVLAKACISAAVLSLYSSLTAVSAARRGHGFIVNDNIEIVNIHYENLKHDALHQRQLDVSRDCLIETIKEMWGSNENKPNIASPFKFEASGCVESPCDYKKTNPAIYQAVMDYCDTLDGQFVLYTMTYVENSTDTDPGVQREVVNFPDCLSQSCEASQYASYTTAYNQIYYRDKGLSSLYVITQTSLATSSMTAGSFVFAAVLLAVLSHFYSSLGELKLDGHNIIFGEIWVVVYFKMTYD